MERRATLGMVRNDGQSNRKPAKSHHAGGSRERHWPRDVCSKPAPPFGVSVPSSRFQSTWETGSCARWQAEGRLRSRLLLAFTRMQVRSTPQVEVGLLASETRRESATGQKTEGEASKAWMVGDDSVAMRDQAARATGSKAPVISGAPKWISRRMKGHA